MTLRNSLLMILALGTIATLTACGGGSSGSGGGGGGSTTPTTIAISSPTGGAESAAINNAFGALSVLVTDASSSPVSGVSVTFTVTAGASGASGSFSGSSATAITVSTGSNGIATTSQTLTANGTAGTFTVVASSGTLTPVTFTLTNTSTVSSAYLPAGSYVFYVAGADVAGAPYTYQYTGVFVASGSVSGGVEQITGGEQDFSDYNDFVSAEPITGGTITQSPDVGSGDNNLIITLNFTDTYINSGAGSTTLNVAMASTTKGLVSEYDGWGVGSGELNFQSVTPVAGNPLCSTAPATPCGYAFAAGGLDAYGYPAANGGVIVVDGASGSISGTGSVVDNNDSCIAGSPCTGASYPANAVSASNVSALDGYGLSTFTINVVNGPTVTYDGYMIDANHIRLIENWNSDTYGGVTGGSGLGQTSVGAFADSSVDGSTYVVSLFGADNSALGQLQAAGQISFTSGNLGGNMSFNDSTIQSPQGGEAITAGTYSVSPTGDFTLSGITDTAGDFTYYLQLYLTGDGHALAISMDAGNAVPDVLGGRGWSQTSGLSASSLSGNYALAQSSWQTGDYVAGDGSVTATPGSPGTISGYQDYNAFGTPNVQSSNHLLKSSTYTNGPAAGIIDLTGGGQNATPLTIYLVDTTQGVVIENDTDLALGYFANQ